MTGVDATYRCPACGLEQSDWSENDGQGYTSGGVTYCSVDCAIRDQARG